MSHININITPTHSHSHQHPTLARHTRRSTTRKLISGQISRPCKSTRASNKQKKHRVYIFVSMVCSCIWILTLVFAVSVAGSVVASQHVTQTGTPDKLSLLPNNNVVLPQQHAKHEGGMDRVQRTRRRLSQPTVYNFHTRTSGKCGQHSVDKLITSSSVCESGAALLEFSDTSASTTDNYRHPPGCYDNSGNLQINSYGFSHASSCSAGSVCICQNNCEAGKYQNENDQSSCKTCVAGQYSDFGQHSCARCPAGKYSSRLGATEFGFLVTIGFSPGSTSKTVTVSSTPAPQSWSFPTPVSVTRIICPSVVDKSNWYPAGSFSNLPNTYQISVNGLDVTATRTDDSVWDDVDLKFICRSDDHCEHVCPAGTWSDVTAIIDVQQCESCPKARLHNPGLQLPPRAWAISRLLKTLANPYSLSTANDVQLANTFLTTKLHQPPNDTAN